MVTVGVRLYGANNQIDVKTLVLLEFDSESHNIYKVALTGR